MAMTEPGAGSDVARIQTRARKDGDEWVLTGQKMFCSNAARAEWVVVWATVDPALGRDGHRAFVVERGTPGFEILKIEHKMGSRGYETASFALDDVRVPADEPARRRGVLRVAARLQGVDGHLQHDPAAAHRPRRRHGPRRPRLRPRLRARRLPGARAGAAQRALERLAGIRRGLHTARLMYLHAVWLGQARASRTCSRRRYAKMYAPPVVLDAVATALDILGEAGVRNDRMLEKLYRDVKILDIGEGTQQVQRLVIARQLFDFPRDA